MTPIWQDYEFSLDGLEFWAQEILSAALEVPAAERPAFLGRACGGSEPLRRRVADLLEHAWELPHEPASDQTCRPGDEIGDCLILSRIGKGGMGEVYKAIQRPLHRLVAVKTLNALSPAERVTLEREAAHTSRLHHENVVTVFDASFEGTQPCVVMEFVDGISLRDWLERERRRQGTPPPDAVRSIVRQTALALREAHRHGLVHRDIKPENILLAQTGEGYQVKIVDFGVARLVHGAGPQIAGTAGYISPEQLTGSPPDSRADLFSLGVVLLEMLSGAHPFTAADGAETFFNTVHKQPAVSDETYGSFGRIIRKAIAKAPSARYQTADELVVDLDALEASTGSNPLLSELPAGVQRWWDEHSTGFTVAVVSFFWGLTSIVLSVLSGAACIRVSWRAASGSILDIAYGYTVELNAGPWYLLGASLFVLGGFGFLQAAHNGLTRTSIWVDGSGDGSMTAMQRVAELNRRYFKWGVPAIVLFSAALILVPELLYRDQNAFGWVQADMASRYVGATYSELRQAGKIGGSSPIEALCDGCDVKVAAVRNGAAGFAQPGALFKVFLAVALAHEVALSCFIMWTAIKVLFFFGFLSSALLGRSVAGPRLAPDLQDQDDYRFGLGRLDNVYSAILLLIALGSVAHFLQIVANLEKGTYFFSGNAAAALAGQVATVLTVVTVLAIVLVTPIAIFLFLTIRAVDAELGRLSALRKRLEEQLGQTRSRDERDRLQADIEALKARRETARRQSLLPLKKPAFVALLAVNVLLLLLLPLANDVGTRGSRGNAILRSIIDSTCSICGNPP